jgi:hypothetical protein
MKVDAWRGAGVSLASARTVGLKDARAKIEKQTKGGK